jgi:hypothetical protein
VAFCVLNLYELREGNTRCVIYCLFIYFYFI